MSDSDSTLDAAPERVWEWWVVRVVARPARGIPAERALTRVDGATDDLQRALWWIPEEGREPTAAEWRELNHLVEVGVFQKMPLGEIGEPVEGFDSDDAAHAWIELRRRAVSSIAPQLAAREYKVIQTLVTGGD